MLCWYTGAGDGMLIGAGGGCWWRGQLTPSLSLPPLFLGCTALAEGAQEATPSPGSSQSETELQEGGGANVDGKETPIPSWGVSLSPQSCVSPLCPPVP